MPLLIELIVLVLVVSLVCWIITLIPFPAGAPPFLRNVLFIIVALICIVWLLDLGGLWDLGVHHRGRVIR